jgi:hypothetical protein
MDVRDWEQEVSAVGSCCLSLFPLLLWTPFDLYSGSSYSTSLVVGLITRHMVEDYIKLFKRSMICVGC